MVCITIYASLVISLWVVLRDDMIDYYPILVIFGNSWSLIIFFFPIVIYLKIKLKWLIRVKKNQTLS